MDSSEIGDGDSVVEEVLTGFALLAHLNIPAQPLVYCLIAQGLVKVTDRQEPVGLCLNQDAESGLYMTADELHACANYIRDVDYHLGFFLWSHQAKKSTTNTGWKSDCKLSRPIKKSSCTVEILRSKQLDLLTSIRN